MEETKATCADQAYHAESGWGRYAPCQRKAGFGPDGKYCRQHAEKFTEGETVTWYRAAKWHDYSCEITPVEVLSEQPKTILVKGEHKATREKKEQQYYSYFPTREQAVEFYERRAESLMNRAANFKAQVVALRDETKKHSTRG